MFNKKCNHCKKELEKNFSFCPNCGKPQKDPKKWGMLGQNDFINEFDQISENMFGGNFLNKMVGSAMKMIEKEMEKSIPQSPVQKSNIKLYVNGKRINPSNIKITKVPKAGVQKQQIQKPINSVEKKFTQKQKELYTKLPKQTPQTNLRRLANTIIYEINLPGVQKVEDVSIVRINKTTEIKALSKKTAYFKVLEMEYPVVNYDLQKNKLILELKIEE
jgi:HSP20 family molecular chaperone IbpA